MQGQIELNEWELVILGVLYEHKDEALFRMQIFDFHKGKLRRRDLSPSRVGDVAESLAEKSLVNIQTEEKPRVENQALRPMYQITKRGVKEWETRNGISGRSSSPGEDVEQKSAKKKKATKKAAKPTKKVPAPGDKKLTIEIVDDLA